MATEMTPEEEAEFEAGRDGFANRADRQTDHLLGPGRVEIGVVAQELNKTDLAHAVDVGSEYEMWKVRYENLTCLNTKVIQGLLTRIETLEARVMQLSQNLT